LARPKQYASAAQKQAAYRARLEASTVLVDRSALERLHERLNRLQAAIGSAAGAGDPFARRCHAASIETMLDKLAAAFQEAASQRGVGTVENH